MLVRVLSFFNLRNPMIRAYLDMRITDSCLVQLNCGTSARTCTSLVCESVMQLSNVISSSSYPRMMKASTYMIFIESLFGLTILFS